VIEQASSVSHPWNPNSQIIGTAWHVDRAIANWGELGARPDKESFIYQSHYREEEWDFMGFPAAGVAHHLRNPYEEDLIYLVGGENHEVEVADFPHLGKRMLELGQSVEIYDTSEARNFGPLEETGTEQVNPSDTSCETAR
jgi:hypothetical protein